jgi:hypothetical protein
LDIHEVGLPINHTFDLSGFELKRVKIVLLHERELLETISLHQADKLLETHLFLLAGEGGQGEDDSQQHQPLNIAEG